MDQLNAPHTLFKYVRGLLETSNPTSANSLLERILGILQITETVANSIIAGARDQQTKHNLRGSDHQQAEIFIIFAMYERYYWCAV